MESLTAYLLIASAFILGLMIGAEVRRKKYYAGVLKINYEDPEKDTYTLDISVPLSDLPSKREIMLRVEFTGTQNSQGIL